MNTTNLPKPPYYNSMNTTNLPKPPPMKEMLSDMYECCDDLLEKAGITHSAELVDLKKGNNARFLQINISLMTSLIGELLQDVTEGCSGCKEYIKEVEEENKTLLKSKNELYVEVEELVKEKEKLQEENKQLKEDNKMLNVIQAKAAKKADSQMRMRQQYELQYDNLSQQLDKLRKQLDKFDK